jgi:hypothetical protein
MDVAPALDLTAIVIAATGGVGTLALLILNLKVQGSMNEIRLEISTVRLEVANFRTESVREHSALRIEVLNNINSNVMPRVEAEKMHDENRDWLERIEGDLKALTQRVGDIS